MKGFLSAADRYTPPVIHSVTRETRAMLTLHLGNFTCDAGSSQIGSATPDADPRPNDPICPRSGSPVGSQVGRRVDLSSPFVQRGRESSALLHCSDGWEVAEECVG